MLSKLNALSRVSLVIVLLPALALALAQGWPMILEGDELTRVVPSSFPFEGQSAPTYSARAR